MCCPERAVEAGGISAIEKGEIDSLDRRFELLLALGLAFLIGRDDGTSRQKFHTQQRGIRPRARRVDAQLAVKKCTLRGVPCHDSRSNEELLAGLCIWGQDHWQNIVVVDAIE